MKKILLLALLAPLLAITAKAQILTLYVNFGSSSQPMASPTAGTYWNNVNDAMPLSTSINLVTSGNASSGISLTITDRWSGQAASNAAIPATTPVAAFNYVNSFQDYLFVQTSDPTAGFTLSGLDSAKQYKFTLYAARVGSITDNRSGAYTFSGATTETLILNASENMSNVVTTGNINPNGSSAITFSMQKAPANNNSNGFTYLQSIEIQVIPEPASWALLAVGLTTVTVLRRRKQA